MHVILAVLFTMSLTVATQSLPGKKAERQSTSTVCDTTNMYRCRGTNMHIDMSQRCDYSQDCLGGDDEDGCACKLHL